MAGAAPRGGRTRRTLLRALFGLGVSCGTAAALTPLVRALREERTRPASGSDTSAAPRPGPGPRPPASPVTEETYRGRSLRVRHAAPGPVEAAVPPPGAYPGPAADDVLIDGRPLPVMRRADGGFMSAVNHYESFPTLLAAARAAVDDLHGAGLGPGDPMFHHA